MGGMPFVEARGDGIVKRIELENQQREEPEKIEGRLSLQARKPPYIRDEPTVDLASAADIEDGSRAKSAVARRKGDNANASVFQETPGITSDRKIDYIAVQQPVAQVMRELGQAVGLRVIAGQGVDAVVRRRHFEGMFPVLMDSLAAEYGLFWFPDGGVIYAEPLESQQTKTVKLKNVSSEQIYEAMDLMGLGRVKSRVQASPGEGSVRVIGPDSFQKTVAGLLTSLEPPDDPDIKIIKYGRREN